MEIKQQIFLDNDTAEDFLIFLATNDKLGEFEEVYNKWYDPKSQNESTKIFYYIRKSLKLPNNYHNNY